MCCSLLCLSVSKTFPPLILGLSIPRRVNLLEDGCLPIPGCWGVAYLLHHHCDHLTQVYIAFMAEISPCFLLCVGRAFQHPFHLGREKKRDWEERKVVPNCIYLFTLFPPSDHTYRKRTTSGPSSRCKCGPGSKLTQSLVQYFNLRSLQVSVYSDNGTTYFYNPDEQLSSQLATGGVSPRKKFVFFIIW